MMTAIVLGLLFFLGVLFYLLNSISADKTDRSSYLKNMAYFFEGQLTQIPEHENSFQIHFKYRGYDCVYEDIQMGGLRPGNNTQIGYLKLKSSKNLTLTFSERSRTQIRANPQTLDDITSFRWGTLQGQVQLPVELGEFNAYTNNVEWANRFFDNPKILKIFLKYKSRGARGHPVLSLQISEGLISLEFHPHGYSRPSILDLEHNVTAAEAYLDELEFIAKVLEWDNGKNPA